VARSDQNIFELRPNSEVSIKKKKKGMKREEASVGRQTHGSNMGKELREALTEFSPIGSCVRRKEEKESEAVVSKNGRRKKRKGARTT